MDSLTSGKDDRNDTSQSGAVAAHVQSPQSSGAATRCTPRLMPVNLPAPVGPNLFILGEPFLHRYYTVYDRKEMQIGFGLSNSKRNSKMLGEREHQVGGNENDEIYFMQVTLTVRIR